MIISGSSNTRQIQVTEDGSHTVAIPQLNITYHSIHGALQESKHIFIQSGLLHALQLFDEVEVLHVFEMGFGTGLNALLALDLMISQQRKLYYHAVELYPLTIEEVLSLNYPTLLGNKALPALFKLMHQAAWGQDVVIHPLITIHKTQDSLLHLPVEKEAYHLIFFDAFAPSVQPELWAELIFEKMYHALKKDGILVSYCCKGDVRRALQSAGFTVEKIQGPPGKKEIIRAKK